MDKTTRTLARYTTSLKFNDLPAVTLHETKRRLIDAIACAMGGYGSEPAVIARKIASLHSGTPAARVLGSNVTSSMEKAAFANTAAIRFLDFNDTYISKGSGHPSDITGACLAVADGVKASGAQTVLAVATAYEVFAALADQVALRDAGWDQGVFVVLGSAAAASQLLGLNLEQCANALAIGVTANIPTRQTRSGELAMWKGCATAWAAQAGVAAALLAREGMTGPTAAFEGKDGVFDQVTGKFELGAMGGDGKAFGIDRTNLKFFPSEYHSQAPSWVALELRKKVALGDIESIDVQTYFTAWSEIGSEPEKWNPQSRETADHSLPYLLALALTDGGIKSDSFSEARMRDPALKALMNRIRISENKSFTARFPNELVTRIEITTRNGQKLEASAAYPKGHAKNPMTDADVESKFHMASEGVLPLARRENLLKLVWTLEQAPNLDTLIDLARV
jgi:2-methylcitrate dehydratase